MRRVGLSIIEFLVVIAIITTLIALVLPAVQAVRESARRTESLNNLRQLGLAVQQYVAENEGKLPGYYVIESKYSRSHSSLHMKLLPYIEQGALLERLQREYNQQSSNSKGLRIPVFLDPADPTLVNLEPFTNPRPTSYIGNGRLFHDEAMLITDVTDGTSMTIAFAGNYAVCSTPFSHPPNLGFSHFSVVIDWSWAGRNDMSDIRAVFSLRMNQIADPINELKASTFTFQVRPKGGECLPNTSQTSRTSGLVVGMLDGSARMVSRSISAFTYWSAVTPNGNETLGSDW